jgi:hypothetical protein
MVEMHISEIGLCSGHSASGVWVDEHARTTVPGLHAAGDLACVPHNYMLGAFVYGRLAGESAAAFCAEHELPIMLDEPRSTRAHARVGAAGARGRPAAEPGRIQAAPHGQRLPAAAQGHAQDGDRPAALRAIRDDLDKLQARDPHELMRAMEVHAIRDCAEMAARASLYRTESRWGLYHNRVDYPSATTRLVRARAAEEARRRDGCFKRPIEPYIVPLDDAEKDAYQHLRVQQDAAGAASDRRLKENPMPTTPQHHQRPRHRRRGQVHRAQGLHRLRRRLPARRARHRPEQGQGLHEVRRMLVLHAVREGLPHRRRHVDIPYLLR